jgi:excisionase family DNA binding protein
MKSTYLSLSEVAQELSLTRRDVRRLIESGKLPGFQFGNQLRVKGEDLLSFVENSKTRPEGACHAI